jgi:adenylosuccinate lyase
MGRIWSDQRRAKHGCSWRPPPPRRWRPPASAGLKRRATSAERGAFDIARIEEIERVTQHDVIAFTTAVAEHVGPSARWLHFGLTSSDVIDTAQAAADA